MITFLAGVIIVSTSGPYNVRFSMPQVTHHMHVHASDLIVFIYNVSLVVAAFSFGILIPFLSLLYVKYNFIPNESEKCWYLFHQSTNVFCFDLCDKKCACCCKCDCYCCQHCNCQQCCDNIVDPCCCDVCFRLIKRTVLHRYCCHSWFGVIGDDNSSQQSFNQKSQQVFIKFVCVWLLFVSVVVFFQTRFAWYPLFRIFVIVSDILTESI